MRRLRMLVASCLLGGCAATPPPGLADGPDPAHEREMFRAVLRELTRPESLPREGDWAGDYGDGNYYGPGFFRRYGQAARNGAQLELADGSCRHDQKLVDAAMTDLEVFTGKLEENLMAALGLVDTTAAGAAADAAGRQRIESFVELLTSLARIYQFYPEKMGGSGFGLTTYGASAINGGLALLNLEWALVLDGEARSKRVSAAREILDAGRLKGFDEGRGYYRFSSTRDGLDLYPNVVQMLALLRLHQLTGEPLPLQRARDLHRAIQPLKVAGEARYRSPYSAEAMGAKTDDYTTLSSQCYTMIALAVLYQVGREQAVRDEVLAILRWVRSHLLQDGKVLHHWMDGRLARPTDPEYYCSGCNLQLLYLIWRLEEWLA